MASRYDIVTHADGSAHVDWWTNDNYDLGYPNEHAELRLDYKSTEEALHYSGGSRYSMYGQRVTVTLNGVMCDSKGNEITEEEREGSPDGWDW